MHVPKLPDTSRLHRHAGGGEGYAGALVDVPAAVHVIGLVGVLGAGRACAKSPRSPFPAHPELVEGCPSQSTDGSTGSPRADEKTLHKPCGAGSEAVQVVGGGGLAFRAVARIRRGALVPPVSRVVFELQGCCGCGYAFSFQHVPGRLEGKGNGVQRVAAVAAGAS